MATTEQTQMTLGEDNTGKRVVVVAMDCSEHSKYALRWYKDNLYRCSDKVYVVYSVEFQESLQGANLLDANVNKEIEPILTQERKHNREKLEVLQKLLKDQEINGEVRAVHAKKPGEGIVRAANELGAKLIVTGTRGLGTIRRTLMGSVSDYILHHANVPVAVCRHYE